MKTAMQMVSLANLGLLVYQTILRRKGEEVLEPDCQHGTTAALMYKQEPAAEEQSTPQESKQDWLRNSNF